MQNLNKLCLTVINILGLAWSKYELFLKGRTFLTPLELGIWVCLRHVCKFMSANPLPQQK
jgi:hypothetical protein